MKVFNDEDVGVQHQIIRVLDCVQWITLVREGV